MHEERSPFSGAQLAAILTLVVLVVAAFHNSLDGAFVFDDRAAILENPTIRRLSDLGSVLSPPNDAGQTVGGRPVVNLTLAVNHALGGTAPRGYHVVNIAIHLLAALTLFGVVRRILRRTRWAPEARPLALAASALWAVHPLVTESVSYVVQRAESLVGLFCLLTVYAFVRSAESTTPGRWRVAAVAACATGMATKEVMVVVPLLVVWLDAAFVAGTWREAWRRRARFHAVLASTWLLLGWLVASAENRGGTAGLGAGDSSWHYLLTQSRAICTYLGLAVWPSPLVFDYGATQIEQWLDALPFAIVVMALLAAVGWAVVRHPKVGFLGAWMFLILAPSSSVVPIPVQPMAEHRMYLPLAAIVVAGVLAWRTVVARSARWAVPAVTIGLVLATIARNDTYRSPLALWGDTAAKCPANARAQAQWADALLAAGQVEAAIARYEVALRLEAAVVASGRTLFGEHRINHGNALLAAGRVDEAALAYEQAVGFPTAEKLARYNLGTIAMQAGRLADAEKEFAAALRLDPRYASAHTNLGSVLLRQDRPEEALPHYTAALQLAPSAKAHTNVGLALYGAGRHRDAVRQFEEALRLDPGFTTAAEFLQQARSEAARGAGTGR